MATLTCPNCAREVSDEAERCPNCGQRLDGMGVEGPPPKAEPRPESSDEAADLRVGGREPLADEGDAPEPGPTDVDSRPRSGFRWTAILGGFLTFLVAGMVFGLFLPPTIASILTLALGLVVAYRMAPDRKMLHAVVAFLAYYLVSIVLGILLGVGAGVGGAGPGGAAGP